MAKRVVVLGSTGSIGRNTLDVIAKNPDHLQLVGLAAHSSIDLLGEQMQRFGKPATVVWDPDKAKVLQDRMGSPIWSGAEGLERLATLPKADVMVVASSGREALIPLVRAIQARKHIALASKELFVMAGELLMHLVKEHGTSLTPIDSEHAAVFQCLQGVELSEVERLTITGSGGPLWSYSKEAMASVSLEQVLNHPKWKMGPKITVDSATLMNKGLEVIEARWLFGLPLEKISIVIHPEAVIHAMVELVDGAIMAQMSPCDMRLPIQYALSFPKRWPVADLPRLDLTQMGGLHFSHPDLDRFPCLSLAQSAAKIGGTACAALNGANDVAVAAYLDGRIVFSDIPRLIGETLEQHRVMEHPSLDEIIEVDDWARRTAEEWLHQWSPR